MENLSEYGLLGGLIFILTILSQVLMKMVEEKYGKKSSEKTCGCRAETDGKETRIILSALQSHVNVIDQKLSKKIDEDRIIHQNVVKPLIDGQRESINLHVKTITLLEVIKAKKS